MKKFFLLFILCIVLQTQAFAKSCYTCSNIPQTKDSLFTFIGKVTGYDFFAVQGAECYFQHYIKKNYNADVKLKIKAKNVKALKNGEFKEVSAKSKKLNCNTFTVSDFKAHTLCPYNKIDKAGDNIVFPYDIPAEFSAVITNDDLLSIVKSQNHMPNDISFFAIKNITWRIENSRLKILLDVSTPLSIVKLTFSTGLEISDGQVLFISPSGVNSSFLFDVNKILPYLNMHSPFSYVLKLARNAHSHIDLEEISIRDDKIYLKGMFLIPRNCDIKK